MLSDATKDFGRYSFVRVCSIEPDRNPAGEIQQYMPQARYEKRNVVPLNAYGEGPFCGFRIPNNLRHEGVYVLTVDGAPRYVGECVNLSSRYNTGYGNISPKNCYEGGQPTNCRVNTLVYEAAKEDTLIELWFLETPKRKAIEDELIQRLNPAWNRKGLRLR
jgi:hypothetical protein